MQDASKDAKIVKHIVNQKKIRGSTYRSNVFASSIIPGALRPSQEQKKKLTEDFDKMGVENDDVLHYYTK